METARERCYKLLKARPQNDDNPRVPASVWRARQPDVFDVEALAGEIGIVDPHTQQPALDRMMALARCNELTRGQFASIGATLLIQYQLLGRG